MIKLVPDWAYNYEEYWQSIKNRNYWFIQIRYAAFIMLVAMFLIAIYIFELRLTNVQINWFIVISISILFYNIILHLFCNKIKITPNKFNALHFSLVQMVLDLIALTLIVYFSGSIETPLYMLYIFHMIIGSLILPGRVIFTMATITIIVFSSIVTFEHMGIITHYHIKEIYSTENVHNVKFIVSSLGIFIFTIYTSVGITSRIAKRLYKREQQLKETIEALNNAEEAKQKYIMAVVHEIKSPIVAAQSIIEIIKNGYVGEVNEKVKEKLIRTRTRTDEALNLINNILRISKLKLLGNISYEKVDLFSLIKILVDQKNDILSNKKIYLKMNDVREDENEIDSDPIMLELVFSNIIGNAIKYTAEKGEIIIDLSNNNNFIIIEVSDSGIGIPTDEINKIFHQFYRATNIPSKYIEGSGLGLSLVKEIVERLNGTVEITSPSKIGNKKFPGTTVTIQFPKNQLS
ncbi:MAG: HAMP domain-containing histidine kinase [Ignavibacteriae bacterium]|nr:HAMP domain-containing histidine kinase [Ignavibacteriota bacterium]MCB0749203.1 HAMP domain-containing histidine kinase [Ignavibacteriota bacterium]